MTPHIAVSAKGRLDPATLAVIRQLLTVMGLPYSLEIPEREGQSGRADLEPEVILRVSHQARPLEIEVPFQTLAAAARSSAMLREDDEAPSEWERAPSFDGFAVSLRERILRDSPSLAQHVRTPWPSGARCAAFLTHDIDVVRWPEVRNAARRGVRMLLRRPLAGSRLKDMALAAEECLRWLGNGMRPYRETDLEPWISLEAAHTVSACYYFAAPAVHHVDDPIYRLDDTVAFGEERLPVTSVMRQLSRAAAEIGVHGSIGGVGGPENFKLERGAVQHALGQPPRGIRQHYLRMDYPRTQASQAAAGFEYDTSVGFNKRVGFRSFTSFPYSPLTETPRFLELPFVLHDVTVPPSLLADRSTLRLRLNGLLDAIEDVGGLFGILWHNYSWREPAFADRFAAYAEIVRLLGERRVWVARPTEICQRWLKYRDSLLVGEGGNRCE